MNRTTFAPAMSATAAAAAIREAGLSARREDNGLALYHVRGRVMLAHESDAAAAVMVALAIAADVAENRIALGREFSAAAAESVSVRWCGVEFGFTGPDWKPTAATRFFAQLGPDYGMGATPAAANEAREAAAQARRNKANAAAAMESFLAAHAEALPPALTVESALAAETFAPGSDAALDARCSGIGPADSFATFYSPAGVPLATYQRPAYIGDSGPFRGLYRLTLTDGRVVAASRNVLTVAGVRKALADYAASTGEGPDADDSRESTADGLAELARQNYRNARDNMESPFRAAAVGRAARLARRAAMAAARVKVPALPAAVPAELNGNPVEAAADHGNGVYTVRVALLGNVATPWVVASYWPALGRTWSWGHYCATLAEADSAWADVTARNRNRGQSAPHAAEYREQPCQQQQARHTPPAAERAALARRMGDAIQRGIDARHGARVWGVAVVPAALAAEFAIAPVRDPRGPAELLADVRAAAAIRGAF